MSDSAILRLEKQRGGSRAPGAKPGDQGVADFGGALARDSHHRRTRATYENSGQSIVTKRQAFGDSRNERAAVRLVQAVGEKLRREVTAREKGRREQRRSLQ